MVIKDKIQKTVKRYAMLTYGLLWAGLFAYTSFNFGYQRGFEETERRQKRLNNQRTVLSSHGFTRLTDVDYDGSPDVLEELVAGKGSKYKIYFKRCFGPSRSIDAEMEVVDADFFIPYQ